MTTDRQLGWVIGAGALCLACVCALYCVTSPDKLALRSTPILLVHGLGNDASTWKDSGYVDSSRAGASDPVGW